MSNLLYTLSLFCSTLLAAMNIREYQKLKQEAQAEYRRKIEAIEMVWKLSGGSSASGTVSNPTANPNQDSITRGSLQQSVRIATKLLPGAFTARDVYNQIVITDPPFAEKIKSRMGSLSGTLKRLSDEKELVLIEVGSGKRPSKYKRTA
jgi:hypothetical protein